MEAGKWDEKELALRKPVRTGAEAGLHKVLTGMHIALGSILSIT